MKNFKKFLLFAFVMSALGIFAVSSCTSEGKVSTAEDKQQHDAARRGIAQELISPNGYVLCDSIQELERAVFGSKSKIKIASIDFVDIKTDKGAVAYINYEEDGLKKNVGFAIGDIKVGHKGGNVKFATTSTKTSLSGRRSTIYRCTGHGCCYVGGETNLDSGQHTFYCKCEGNPNQNSGCSLVVTVEEDDKLTPRKP